MLYDNGSGEKRLGPGLIEVLVGDEVEFDSDVTFYEEGAGPFAVKMVK